RPGRRDLAAAAGLTRRGRPCPGRRVFVASGVRRGMLGAAGAGRPALVAHRLESGPGVRTAPELLGHKDVSTMRVNTPVLNRGGRGVRSPLDGLGGGPGPAGRG